MYFGLLLKSALCYIFAMTDDNKAANEGQSAEDPAEESATREEVVTVPTLAEDLADLEKLNLMRALMLQLQGGKHPYASTDALLRRRMNFDPAEFQGPYIVRLICTIMMVFVCCSILWFMLWLMASALNLTYFVRLLSTGLATLIAAMAGVAIFHPSSVPDEKKLKEAMEKRLHQLRSELENESIQRENAATKSNSEAPKPTAEPPPAHSASPQQATPAPAANNIEPVQQPPAEGAAPGQPVAGEPSADIPQQTQEGINEQETTNTNTN